LSEAPRVYQGRGRVEARHGTRQRKERFAEAPTTSISPDIVADVSLTGLPSTQDGLVQNDVGQGGIPDTPDLRRTTGGEPMIFVGSMTGW
jgi:hypothetical protein